MSLFQSSVPGPVQNLQAQGLSTNSSLIQVTWQRPNTNACPVDSYQVTYTKVEKIACAGNLMMTRHITVPSNDVVFMLHDLEPYSRYLVFVSALNMMGEGETNSTFAATISDSEYSYFYLPLMYTDTSIDDSNNYDVMNMS